MGCLYIYVYVYTRYIYMHIHIYIIVYRYEPRILSGMHILLSQVSFCPGSSTEPGAWKSGARPRGARPRLRRGFFVQQQQIGGFSHQKIGE